MAKNSFLALLFLTGAFLDGASQTSEISGIITSTADVENVNVVNITSQTNSITDASGKFIIEVRRQDTLQFFSLVHLP